MIRRSFLKALALAGFALAGAASAQDIDDNNVLMLRIGGEANGVVEILMRPDIAPQHVEQISALAREGAYNGVAFHRVIEGFMAQTGDVQFAMAKDYSPVRAGQGGSSRPDIPAEFSNLHFGPGVLGMARSNNPDSANSQFFIMFADAPHLNGKYTIFGRVIEGMDVVNSIKRPSYGEVIQESPDYIASAWIKADGEPG